MTVPAEIRENVPLAPMTTFGVGGPARYFVEAQNEDDLTAALDWARRRGIEATFLGGGSNVVVSDEGFDGLVIRIAIAGIESIEAGRDRVLLRIGAGESLDALVERAVALRWAGIECLSGIPGYVGATPIQNVGAYGQEIGERVVLVRAMQKSTGEIALLDAAACGFSYRSSIFKEAWKDRYAVLSVTLALDPGGVPSVRYPELSRELAQKGVDPTSLSSVRDAVIAIRRSKSMVIDVADPNHRSAGSFFMNPIVTAEEASAVESRAAKLASGAGPMPRFDVAAGIKLSAAWLIERAGFSKGTGEGRVGISTRHALAIVNRGDATAKELIIFAAKVRAAVRDRFGVSLAHEPVLLGFDRSELAPLDECASVID